MYSETANSYVQSLRIELSRNVENCAKVHFLVTIHYLISV